MKCKPKACCLAPNKEKKYVSSKITLKWIPQFGFINMSNCTNQTRGQSKLIHELAMSSHGFTRFTTTQTIKSHHFSPYNILYNLLPHLHW
jgi:hypothetical protein